LLELANCLQVKAANVFLTTIFRVGLQPYFKLATSSMTKDTFIKYKETTVICNKTKPVITNYNVLMIQLKSKLVAQPIITYTTTKQQLTCSNYGKTGHGKETYIIRR
jgi:hypothetical protein